MFDLPKQVQFFAIKPTNDLSNNFEFTMKNKHCSHITMIFKPKGENKDRFMNIVGKEFTVKSKYLLQKKGVVSVLVLDSINEYCGDSEPHITIETDGQAPSVSNDIIKQWNEGSEDIVCTPMSLEFSGILCGAVYGKKGLTYVSNRDWLN